MISVAASAFATAVTARYASRHQYRRVTRVLLQLPRRVSAAPRARRTHAGLTLRLTHRLAAENHIHVRLTRVHALMQRVERHVSATRHVVERTQRVEHVTLRSGTLPQLVSGASERAASAPTARIVVPPLPRVLRRPQSAPTPEPARTFETKNMRTQSAPPAIDVARLTDEVMRGIDKRLAAWRERRGRV